MRTAAELVLGREPDAVPKARRFVRSSLTGEPDGTVHSVEVVVTELVTNGLLYGEPPVSIRLILLGKNLRVEVEDEASALPVPGRQNADSMTGRGLALVAALSSAWGVDPGRQRGKVVWAELPRDESTPPAPQAPSPRPPTIDPTAMAAARSARLTGPQYTIRLGDVPTRLLLEVKTHIDNVVRELTLVGGRGHTRGSELPPDLVALVRTVVEEVAEARFELKRLAEEAAARGDDLTEVTLRVPASYAEAGERYIEALEEADRYARAARLLTMASPPSHRVFREWYVRSIVHQLEALTSGRRPDPPEPLAAVLARRLDELGTQLLRSPPD